MAKKSRKITPRAGRPLHKLPRNAVEVLTEPGLYSDGGNLYLHVRADRAPAWVFIYSASNGKTPWIGIGPARAVSIDRARREAQTLREDRAAGLDPLVARERERSERRAEEVAVEQQQAMTKATLLREARRLHEVVSPAFRNPKHVAQWINSIEQHVPEATLVKPIAEVTAGELLEFLQPLYVRLPETARRVRMRLDNVFDDAILRELCTSNPAAAIRKRLGKLSGKRKKKNFAALPWAKVPALVAQLREVEGTAARALEFAVLTAARTGEALGMTWAEVDLRQGVWTVPKERMKGEEPHTVFLSARALAILQSMRGFDPKWVFPSLQKPGFPLSNMSMLMVLRRLAAAKDTTVHGLCRASFSTWANERGYRGDVVEAALAHREADRVRAAYNRAQFLAERRQLLIDWAAFVAGGKSAAVSSLSARKRKATV